MKKIANLNIFYKIWTSNGHGSSIDIHRISPETSVNKIDKLNQEVLSWISNREFLGVNRDARLEHVTNPAIKSAELKTWDSVNITFTFNGKFNTELYLRTTAGQVMPEDIQIIEAHGSTWVRNGLLGEFFDTNWKRLVIRDGSQLIIKWQMSPEDKEKKNIEIATMAEKYKWEKNYDIILASLKRNIPADIAVALFGKKMEWFTDENLRRIEIEDILTEFGRMQDYFATDFQGVPTMKWNQISSEFITYYITSNNIKLDDSLLADLWITEGMRKTYGILGSTRVSWRYWTDAPISASVKLMSDLNWTESSMLARKIFHDGPATDLLIALDGGNGTMIKRMVALWYHEGWLMFWRQNPDPASGYNIGTFQIGWSGSTPETSMKKYQDCFRAGIELAKQYGINTSMDALSDPGQRDLMTHLWYINIQRGWENTFNS